MLTESKEVLYSQLPRRRKNRGSSFTANGRFEDHRSHLRSNYVPFIRELCDDLGLDHVPVWFAKSDDLKDDENATIATFRRIGWDLANRTDVSTALHVHGFIYAVKDYRICMAYVGATTQEIVVVA